MPCFLNFELGFSNFVSFFEFRYKFRFFEFRFSTFIFGIPSFEFRLSNFVFKLCLSKFVFWIFKLWSLEWPSWRCDWYKSSCIVGRKFEIIYLYLLSHPSRLLMGTLHLPLHAVSEIGGVENCWIVLLKYEKLDCYWADFWFFWNRAYIFFGLGGFLGIEKIHFVMNQLAILQDIF